MRTFIAIDLPQKVKAEISALQSRLRPLALKGRWKYVDNFHLTLKFLGEIDGNMAARVSRMLADVSKRSRPFTLEISGMGFFPGKEGITRVLWLGLGGDLDELTELQGCVDAEAARLGFPPERGKYRPHITIAQDISFSKSFQEIAREVETVRFQPVPVDRVILFKSEQIGTKRVYTPLKTFGLSGA